MIYITCFEWIKIHITNPWQQYQEKSWWFDPIASVQTKWHQSITTTNSNLILLMFMIKLSKNLINLLRNWGRKEFKLLLFRIRGKMTPLILSFPTIGSPFTMNIITMFTLFMHKIEENNEVSMCLRLWRNMGWTPNCGKTILKLNKNKFILKEPAVWSLIESIKLLMRLYLREPMKI